MSLFDFNKLFSDPLKNLSSAQYALQRTEPGRSGLVRVDLDAEDKLIYRLVSTGESFSSYDTAFSRASSEMITKFNIIKLLEKSTGRFRSLIPSAEAAYNPKVEQVTEYLNSINSRLSELSKYKTQLQKLGMSSEELDDLISGRRKISIDLSQLKDQTDVRNFAKDFIQKQLKKIGKENLFPFLDKDGANVLRFKSYSVSGEANPRIFTQAQIHYMLQGIEQPLLNSRTLAGLFSGAKDFEDFLGKLPKRERGIFGERDLTITQDDFFESQVEYEARRQSKVRKISLKSPEYRALKDKIREDKLAMGDINTVRQQAFDDSILIVQESLDYLREATGLDYTEIADLTEQNRAKDASVLTKNIDVRQSIKTALDGIAETGDAPTVDEFIEKYFGKTSGIFREELRNVKTSKELLNVVEESSTIAESEKDIIRKVFKGTEQDFDGDAAINIRLHKSRLARLNSQIREVEQEITNNPSNEVHKETLRNLKHQRRLIGKSNLYQITGRGVAGEGQPKFAAQIVEFVQGLNHRLMYIGASGIKSELTGMEGGEKGFREIVLSGFGQARGTVFADPNLIATHPEIFASEASLQSMQKNAQNVLREMAEEISRDMLSPKVVKQLENSLIEDITGLPEPIRLAKQRNRGFAESILQLHEMGVGPKNSVEMMNLLQNHFQTRMFTMKETAYGTLYNPVLPDTTRHAISTEPAHAAVKDSRGKPFKPVLGTGKIKTTISRTGKEGEIVLNEADKTMRELATFRIHNGRILFAAGAVGEYFHALGGFDLDDKGLLTPVSYVDEFGRKRIMTSITRQPTSFQENIYTKAFMDKETLIGMFADKEDFMKTVAQMAEEENSTEGIRYINSVLRELPTENRLEIYATTDTGLADIENQIHKVYEKMGKKLTSIYDDNNRILRNIEAFGDSALRNTIELSRSKLQTIAVEERTSKFIEIFPLLKEDISKSLDDFSPVLEGDFVSNLRAAIDSDNAQRVSDLLESAPADNRMAVAAMREKITLSRLARGSESSDILGVYVNRSMVVGSTLNQLDDFTSALGESAKAKDLLKFLGKEAIGVIPSETAIDKSIAFSLFKGFEADIKGMITSSMDADAAESTLQKFLNSTKGTGLTVDALGEQMTVTMGRRIGKMTAIMENSEALIGQKMEEKLFPMIDTLLLGSPETGGRLSTKDQAKVAEGILQGLEEFDKEIEFGGLQGRAKEIRDTLKGIDFKNDRAAATQLADIFGKEKGVYSFSSKANNVAKEAHALSESLKRMGLAAIGKDQATAATQVSEEAMTAAKLIIQQNKDDLQRVISLSDELSDAQTIDLTGRQIALGQKIAADFNEAMKFMSSGVSRQDLHDAIAKQAMVMEEKFTTGSLSRIMSGSLENQEFNLEMQSARVRRIAKFFGEIEKNEIASTIRGKLAELDKTLEVYGTPQKDLNKKLQILLDGFGAPSSDEEKGTLRLLLQEQDALNNLTEEQAREAKRARSVLETNQMNDEINAERAARLNETGANTATDSKMNQKFQRMMAGEELYDAAEGAKYKRISNFLKEDLRNLWENNKVFKKSVYATAALIAGSLAYSAASDRSPESLGGPALLPGGSAYEDYPQRSPQMPSIGPNSYSPAMSYKVNLYGDRSDVSRFTELAGSFGNFDTDTTMYSGIPEVGRDPYQELASSY